MKQNILMVITVESLLCTTEKSKISNKRVERQLLIQSVIILTELYILKHFLRKFALEQLRR